MPESYIEREDKFDIDPGFELPDLRAADPAVAEIRTAEHQLRSEYFDTADRALGTAVMTFRHRQGSTDNGWQLKVPHAAGREEVRVEGSEDEPATVPAELERLLLGVRRGQPLLPVATLELTRVVHELLDEHGQKLAEVAFDTVVSTTAPAPVEPPTSLPEPSTMEQDIPAEQIERRWQEVEVELGAAGDEHTLARVGKALRRAGARYSDSGSKLARALGQDSIAPEPTDLLQRYLLEQQQAILAGDLALRRDESAGDDEVIHKTRVAIRRFRSTLRSFLDRDATRALDEELRWYAGVLGEVRDRQVMRKRLLGLVDELTDAEVLGPVRTRIEVQLLQEQDEALNRVSQVLTSERYLGLLTAIDDFRLSLHRIPDKRLVKLMERADRKAAKRLGQIDDDPVLLHRARKAAKRARYAGELVQPVIGKRASKQAGRHEALQDLLGEHQDSIVTAELLLRLGEIAGTTPGENGFTFGLLYERELARAVRIRRGLAR